MFLTHSTILWNCGMVIYSGVLKNIGMDWELTGWGMRWYVWRRFKLKTVREEQVMISLEKPQDFNAEFEVVSCFLRRGEKFLTLLRQDDKPQGNRWGLPAGKINKDECVLEAMCREIKEETGVIISGSDLQFFETIFVRYLEYDFVYHVYSLVLTFDPDIQINVKEHKEFKWVTPYEALRSDLVQDEDSCIMMYFGIW